MFCSNCGSEISGNFCTNCGAPVSGVSSPTPQPTKIEPIQTTLTGNGKTLDIEDLFKIYGKNRKAIASKLVFTLKMATQDAYIVTDAFLLSKEDTPNPTFWQRFGNEVSISTRDTNAAKNAEASHLAELDAQGVCYCPKCHSTSVSGNKKGFGIGKAVVGAAMTGGIGLVAGNLGSKKIRVTCLKCGHQWWAGK